MCTETEGYFLVIVRGRGGEKNNKVCQEPAAKMISSYIQKKRKELLEPGGKNTHSFGHPGERGKRKERKTAYVRRSLRTEQRYKRVASDRLRLASRYCGSNENDSLSKKESHWGRAKKAKGDSQPRDSKRKTRKKHKGGGGVHR